MEPRPAETYRGNYRRALSLAQKALQPKDRKERRRKRKEEARRPVLDRAGR